jgi:hypothetical protein
MSNPAESFQAEEADLKRFRKDRQAHVTRCETMSIELAEQHRRLMERLIALPVDSSESVKLKQEIDLVTKQRELNNNEITAAHNDWKEAGQQLAQLRSTTERRLHETFVNLADLPRYRAGPASDGGGTSGRSSNISDSLATALRGISPQCMVCGRTDKVTNAHILKNDDLGPLRLRNDVTNYLRLCGTFREKDTCHDMFDKGSMAFAHVHGADNTQWVVIGGNEKVHGKPVTLATQPHRRALVSRYRHALESRQLQIPAGALSVRPDEELSETLETPH